MSSLLFFMQVCFAFAILIGRSETNDDRVVYPSDLSVHRRPLEPSESEDDHHHHHPGTFRHSPEFHAANNIPLPHADKDVGVEEEKKYYSDSENEIPLDYIQKLNDYNVSDLLINFVEGYEEEKPVSLFNRFGESEEGEERNAVKKAPKASCIPELKAVKLVENADPGVLYVPPCTRIERCGGCCNSHLISCQPTNTEIVTYEVIKTKYTGGSKLKYVGKELVQVEKHLKCACDCKLKAKDCNVYQEYRKNECKCACKNSDEEKKCYKRNATKLWDPEICACVCRDVIECSTGFKFDQNNCTCVRDSMKRRYIKGYVADFFTTDDED